MSIRRLAPLTHIEVSLFARHIDFIKACQRMVLAGVEQQSIEGTHIP